MAKIRPIAPDGPRHGPGEEHDTTVHLQKAIEFNGQQIEVDEGIADVIERLLTLGWTTTHSCEMISDKTDQGYIAFATYAGAREFFDLVHQKLDYIEWSNNENGSASLYFSAEDLALIEGLLNERLAKQGGGGETQA